MYGRDGSRAKLGGLCMAELVQGLNLVACAGRAGSRARTWWLVHGRAGSRARTWWLVHGRAGSRTRTWWLVHGRAGSGLELDGLYMAELVQGWWLVHGRAGCLYRAELVQGLNLVACTW